MSQLGMFDEPKAEASPYQPDVERGQWWDVHAFPSKFADISEKAAREGQVWLVKAETADEAAWKVADSMLDRGEKVVVIESVRAAA